MKNILKKKTKIVATISDLNCDVTFLKKLYDNGMDVVRLNTAHQNHDDALKVINNVRAISNKIPLIIDTKGPEIRTMPTKHDFNVDKGQILNIKGDPKGVSTPDLLYVSYPHITRDIPIGNEILIDDGELSLIVKDIKGDILVAEVQNSGVIKSNKSINVPNVSINLPSLTKKDINFIKFAIEQDIDFIAHSFVRNKEDVLAIQKILDEHNKSIKIIAKIENREGVDNIDEILDHAYGIMIARGDLAIEIPREKIPFIQKSLIKKCIDRRKPVITATQMLHTMIHNPRPTRAEVSDVANAIYDGTDALMLSGETAYGDYPLEAVKTMNEIALEIESTKEQFLEIPNVNLNSKVSAYLCKAAVSASVLLDAEAIIADSLTGKTIRNIAGFRGQKPILTICYDEKVMRKLALLYGVYAFYIDKIKTTKEFFIHAFNRLEEEEFVTKDTVLILIAGHFGKDRHASHMEINTVKGLLRI